MPVTVLARLSPGPTHIHIRPILELKLEPNPTRPAYGCTHQTRLHFVFRREGIRVDRSAINLDTSTGSRSPVKNFGRFSFRGPCRLAHKMAVRETSLARTPTHVKTYPKGSGHFSSTTRARSRELRSFEPILSILLKLLSPSLTIGATDGAAIEHPSRNYSKHDFNQGSRAPRSSSLSTRQSHPSLKVLRGHS